MTVKRIDNTVLLVGAGFSKAAGIPATTELGTKFLSIGPTDATPEQLQAEITKHLKKYWKNVFGYSGHGTPPSFEDHFTVLDLAANAGHNVGRQYTPSMLRAIRRLSIHRVFDILDSNFVPNQNIRNMLKLLLGGKGNTVVSTNWDIAVEGHLDALGRPYHYGVPMDYINGSADPHQGLPILKLHGSSNWAYCDCCRRLYRFLESEGKGALKSWSFLESRDFASLKSLSEVVKKTLRGRGPLICNKCKSRLSARVATFSFDKALGYFQFQGVWEEALRRLREAKQWIFIGYSLPDADFELRHMLKTAELAEGMTKSITVVVGADKLGEEAMERYQRFFGTRLGTVSKDGFDKWYKNIY